MLNSNELFQLVRGWAADRNLIAGSTAVNQMLKLTEEVGELARAVGKQDMKEIVDGIGDCMVVLTILAAQHGCTAEGCLLEAYNTIRDRKGKMINGMFVKEAE